MNYKGTIKLTFAFFVAAFVGVVLSQTNNADAVCSDLEMMLNGGTCPDYEGGEGSSCETDEDCSPGWGCFHEPDGTGVCQSAYGGGDPTGLCATNAQCGGCQDCDVAAGHCVWRCDSNVCHFHGSTASGSCPGEAGY